jgi:hypothetical protein
MVVQQDYWSFVSSIDNPAPLVVPSMREESFAGICTALDSWSINGSSFRLAHADQNAFRLVHELKFVAEWPARPETVTLLTQITAPLAVTRVTMNFTVLQPSYRQTYAPKKLVYENLDLPIVDQALQQIYQLVKNDIGGQTCAEVYTQFAGDAAFAAFVETVFAWSEAGFTPEAAAVMVEKAKQHPEISRPIRYYLASLGAVHLVEPLFADL